jgi:hypothetical protein
MFDMLPDPQNNRSFQGGSLNEITGQKGRETRRVAGATE